MPCTMLIICRQVTATQYEWGGKSTSDRIVGYIKEIASIYPRYRVNSQGRCIVKV